MLYRELHESQRHFIKAYYMNVVIRIFGPFFNKLSSNQKLALDII